MTESSVQPGRGSSRSPGSVTGAVRGSVEYACQVSTSEEHGLNADSFLMTPEGSPVPIGQRTVQGIGYCADASLGALLLSRWAEWTGDSRSQRVSAELFAHSLHSGYLDGDVPVHLYRDAERGEFLNTLEGNPAYLDVGHMAHALSNLLRWVSRNGVEIPPPLASAARRLHGLVSTMERCSDGWIPRRTTHEGRVYPYRRVLPDDQGMFALIADDIHSISGVGLYVVEFLSVGDSLGLWDGVEEVQSLVDAFVSSGGHFGSINTDTDDTEESFAVAVAIVTLLSLPDTFSRPDWTEFALEECLPRIWKYRIADAPADSGVEGLFRLAETYPAACMAENAVVAQAFFQASQVAGAPALEASGMEILAAMAAHGLPDSGFLAAEIDWTGMRPAEQHLGCRPTGPRSVTHPYRNNLQWVDALVRLQAPEVYESEAC